MNMYRNRRGIQKNRLCWNMLIIARGLCPETSAEKPRDALCHHADCGHIIALDGYCT